MKKTTIFFLSILAFAAVLFAADVTKTAKSAVKPASIAVKKAPAPAPTKTAVLPVVNFTGKPVFYSLNVDEIIDNANADYIVKGIEQAEKDGAEGVLITIQTPGGLDKSMRRICKKMLESTIPVITYVSPKGSRCASAGAFILLASHVAAMAEGTHVGTAHPIDYNGSAVSEKITNDAVTTIQGYARLHGRNEQWASDAVLKNVSTSEVEALQLKVIDYIARDVNELMTKLDKKEVVVNGSRFKFNTAGYTLVPIPLTSAQKFIHMLSDPNIVYVLFLIGIYGLIFELANAATTVFPGIAGIIALVLAFTGFESLPINNAGAILIGFSALLFFLEMMHSTHGALALGGGISLILGSFLMFPARAQGVQWAASWFLIGGMIILTIAFFVLVVGAVVKAFKKRTISGVESLVGKMGVAKTHVKETGVVNVGGEEWQAHSDESIKERDIVEVVEVQGLKMKVKKVERKKA